MGEGYIVCYFKEWLRLEILMVLVWKQMECKSARRTALRIVHQVMDFSR